MTNSSKKPEEAELALSSASHSLPSTHLVTNTLNSNANHLQKKRSKKFHWTTLFIPEIPVTRFSCITSASLRPKLGLCILSIVLVVAILFIVIPLVTETPLMMAELKQESAKIQHPESVQAVSEANRHFTSQIYPLLAKSHGLDNNMVSSPFSLSSVLAMLHAGAGGNTLEQIRKVMGLPDKEEVALEGFEDLMNVIRSNENFTLEAANRLYVKDGYGLLKSFLDKAMQHFKAEAENLDFSNSAQAAQTINHWVEARTNDKIKDLIPESALNSLTRLVLVNAVYFKGNWAQKFDAAKTTKGDFVVSPTETVKVDMMHRTGDYVMDAVDDLGAIVLRLPYKGDRLSMMLFLSKDPKGFSTMEEKFGSFDFANFKSNGHPVKVDVFIPKFKLETEFNLNEPLQSAGMTDMFDEAKADFSRLTEAPKDLFVSQVMQKAFIEVNEEGTEAAAATGAVMMLRMAVMNERFICNRPFLFAIKDDMTGLVLFTGRVVNPAKN